MTALFNSSQEPHRFEVVENIDAAFLTQMVKWVRDVSSVNKAAE